MFYNLKREKKVFVLLQRQASVDKIAYLQLQKWTIYMCIFICSFCFLVLHLMNCDPLAPGQVLKVYELPQNRTTWPKSREGPKGQSLVNIWLGTSFTDTTYQITTKFRAWTDRYVYINYELELLIYALTKGSSECNYSHLPLLQRRSS